MALSEQERQILDQMERELRKEDPGLASAMSASVRKSGTSNRKVYSPRRVATGIVLAVVGLIIPIVGITIGITWLAIIFGVVGFGLMLAGVLMVAIPTEDGSAIAKPKKTREASFMQRQQRKWDQRQQR